MVSALKHYETDPQAGMNRGPGLYYYRGRIKENGFKPTWSKYSASRDLNHRSKTPVPTIGGARHTLQRGNVPRAGYGKWAHTGDKNVGKPGYQKGNYW